VEPGEDRQPQDHDERKRQEKLFPLAGRKLKLEADQEGESIGEGD